MLSLQHPPSNPLSLWRRLSPAKAIDAALRAPCRQAWDSAAAAGWHVDAPSAYCHRCGRSAGPGEVTVEGCSACARRRLPWDRLLRLGPYDPPLQPWILQMKFAGSWTWAAWFGRLLAQQALPIAADAQHVIVCPVPLHWLRRWRRGYNQSHLLAAAFARAGGWPLTPILRRRRHAPPQTAVPASHRAANVRHCFALAPVDLSGCSVWLIDDVKTSGATAAACSRLLRRAGAQSVWLAVVAVAGS